MADVVLEARERQWRAEEDANTLRRYVEITKDESRMKAAESILEASIAEASEARRLASSGAQGSASAGAQAKPVRATGSGIDSAIRKAMQVRHG